MSRSTETVSISADDIIASVEDALQYISYFHPPDYIAHLVKAYEREQSQAAKGAIGQILANSRMAAFGRRPICQDTGLVVVFAKVGMRAFIDGDRPLLDLVNEGVRRAYLHDKNPLRASLVEDPIFGRHNTKDNTPAVLHTEMVPGGAIEFHVAAKGGGSENKARFATLNPGADLVEWVVSTVETLGSGWCPPGIISIGVGGGAEKAMLLAKEALNEPVDMTELKERGPADAREELRIELFDKINALGIGAQGLGGLTTVVDVKVSSYPSHAASKPVALIPQCAANRHISFKLDGSGPAALKPPDLSLWPEIDLNLAGQNAIHVNLDTLTKDQLSEIPAGEMLLISGTLLTARDAAHKRIVDMLDRGEDLPVDLKGRVLYYVGPAPAVGDEAVGPAGPTTSMRMDDFIERIFADTGVIAMIGKAERGPEAIQSIMRHKGAYMIAVGGAAYLISKAIKSSRVVAFEELGMEAIHEFRVENMPVTLAIDSLGNSIHNTGPKKWRSSNRSA